MTNEQVDALNKIVAMIDTRAAEFKNEYSSLSQAKRFANRKLIIDLIEDAKALAANIKPAPAALLDDLRRLAEQLNRLA